MHVLVCYSFRRLTLLLLLLSYHRSLGIISEALELRLEGGLISHSWCMCVVSHGYGVLDGVEDGSGGWYALWDKANWVGRMSGDAGAFPECEGNTLMIPDHPAVQVRCSG